MDNIDYNYILKKTIFHLHRFNIYCIQDVYKICLH